MSLKQHSATGEPKGQGSTPHSPALETIAFQVCPEAKLAIHHLSGRAGLSPRRYLRRLVESAVLPEARA